MKKNIIIALGGIALTFAVYIAVQLLSPLPVGSKTIEVQIPKGATFRQAVEIFSQEGVIRDKNFFILAGRITGLDRRIRAGYYQIYRPMDALDLLRVLRDGQIIEFAVTVIEGDSLQEIAGKLSEKGIVTRETFLALASDAKFLYTFDIDSPSAEGYLFPDTYRIPKGMEPRETVAMMINNLRGKLTFEMMERIEELGFSENEILTLASIIEKEAVTDDERAVISAVYHNRLKKRIPLQADPTAIYGIKGSKEKILLSDLKRKTPYNTYVVRGLPPGPIASPGIKSIMAALYPADVPYIYFVSNNDGTHTFSVTLAEHNTAVNAYREKKKNQDSYEEIDNEGMLDDEES
jgi:UPF0755 protein